MDFDGLADATIEAMSHHLRRVGTGLVGRLADDAADGLYRLVSNKLGQTVSGRQRLGEFERMPSEVDRRRAMWAAIAGEARADPQFARALEYAMMTLAARGAPGTVQVSHTGTHVPGSQVAGRDIRNVDKSRRYQLKIGTFRLNLGLGSLTTAIAVILVGGTAAVVVPRVVGPTSQQAIADEFNDRLEKSLGLTFTAVYETVGENGNPLTLVHQRGSFANVNSRHRTIDTPGQFVYCTPASGAWACARARTASGRDELLRQIDLTIPLEALYVQSSLRGFLNAAITYPGARVGTGSVRVVGISATCVTVTNLDPTDGRLGISLCASDAGVLTGWAMSDGVCAPPVGDHPAFCPHGGPVNVELVSYTETADPGAFEPPPGAKVTDV